VLVCADMAKGLSCTAARLFFWLAAIAIPSFAASGAGCTVLPAQPVGAQPVGLKPEPVAELLATARKAKSSSFAVFKDGKYVAGFGETTVVPVYSVTKAVVSLAAGRLFTSGQWKSVDAPVGSLLQEFAADPKGAITLRQLMSHTSGIRDARNEQGRVLKEWNTAPDWVAAALARPMSGDAPGAVFKYNNQGPALVAAAVERAAGIRLDRFLRREIFDPLCIGKTSWDTDKAGHAAGYTGLSISAFDLAKLGQLVLTRGLWGSRRVLSEEWIRQSALEVSQGVAKNAGLLWFMQMEQPRFPLPVMVYHDGDGGQYLAIFPNHGIVVARTTGSGDSPPEQVMGDFYRLAADLLIKRQR